MVGTDFTLAYWAAVNQVTSMTSVFSWGTMQSSGGMTTFGFNPAPATMRFDFFNINNAATPDPAPTIGSWHHYAFTWQQSTGAKRFWYDGVLITEILTAPSTDIQFNAVVGGYATNPSQFPFIGLLDELHLVRAALTETEIQTLIATNVVPSGITREVHFNFNSMSSGGDLVNLVNGASTSKNGIGYSTSTPLPCAGAAVVDSSTDRALPATQRS